MPTAIEEFLRAYSPVTMAREVMKETDHQRLPGQARQHGAAVVPGGQPRSGDVSGCRQGGDRPQGEPPRRVRPRHSPLRRLQPRAHGNDGGDRGVAEADSGLQARSGRQGHSGRKARCADRASFRCCSATRTERSKARPDIDSRILAAPSSVDLSCEHRVSIFAGSTSRIFGAVCQNGYVVRDIRAAMDHWVNVMGVGALVLHRSRSRPITSATAAGTPASR